MKLVNIDRINAKHYYLYKEWYDPEARKKHSKLIGRCDELEKIVEELEKLKQGVENHWCGGWDLNPRRPTPSGPKPDPFDLARAPPHFGLLQILFCLVQGFIALTALRICRCAL